MSAPEIDATKPGVQAMIDEFKRLEDTLIPLSREASEADWIARRLRERERATEQARQQIVGAIAALHGHSFDSYRSKTTREQYTKLVERFIGREKHESYPVEDDPLTLDVTDTPPMIGQSLAPFADDWNDPAMDVYDTLDVPATTGDGTEGTV